MEGLSFLNQVRYVDACDAASVTGRLQQYGVRSSSNHEPLSHLNLPRCSMHVWALFSLAVLCRTPPPESMALRVLQASYLQGLARRDTAVLPLIGGRLGGARVPAVVCWRGLKGQANPAKHQETTGRRVTPARLVVTHSR